MLALNYMGTTADQLSAWLWKPFHRCCVNVRRRWDTKASIIDVFATFLLLAYCKLLLVSLYLLGWTNIYNADNEHVSGTSYVLIVGATVHYFSEEHLPFAITAIVILLSLLLPPYLLIFYPCKVFKWCLNCCHKRRWHTHLLKHIMDFTKMWLLEGGIFDPCLECICFFVLHSSLSIII